MGKYYNNRPTSKLEQIRDSAIKIHDRIDPGHDIISHDEGEPGYYNDRPKTKLETIRDAAECIAQITENPTEEYQYEDLRNVDVASFVSEVTAPIKKLTVGIEPVQSGSGDPSPDNVRPITGWTGAKVTRCGKNLLPNKTYQWVTNNLIIGDDTNKYGVYLKAGTYTISANRTKPCGIYCATETSGNILIASSSVLSGTLVVPNDDYYKFWLYTGTGVSASDVEWFQLELGSTATSYEPYQGETYDITFPTEAGTVYGGTLDVTNGVLTVDRAMVDLGSLSWTGWTESGTIIFHAIATGKVQLRRSELLCSQYKPHYNVSVWADLLDFEITGAANERIYIRDSRYSTVADFKTAVSGVNVVYELATPVTYQLTPTQIATLLGENNVWADTGEIVHIKYPYAEI